ncbi:MAG: DUF2142 domain-containing protein [Bacilli bacterium]|nr:DUF2142 domain-containing protein [Bacilli bacterium]
MKKIIEQIKKMNKEELTYGITYFVLSCFGIIYTAQKGIHLGMKFLCLLEVLVVGVLIGLYFITRNWMKKKVPLHKIYLAVAIVLGAFYIFAFPPGQLPDEQQDYERSLEISEFGLITPMHQKTAGRKFSKNIDKVYKSYTYSELLKNSNLKLEGKKKFYPYANKSLYNFVCYIPQAIGIGLTHLIGLPILSQIYFGKICNYALFVLLVYLSIKLIPTKKFLIFFTALLPITIQEGASLSPDSMTIATSIALISFILWSRNTDKVFTKKHYISLASLAIALSLCKIVYLPLCFLMFLIPKERFGNLNKKKIYCIILSVIVIILNLVWLKFTSKYLTAFHGRSNSTEQLQYILSNPIRYILILFTTIDVYLWSYLEQMVGHSLGRFVVGTSYVMSILAVYFLVNLTKEKNKEEKDFFNIWEKIFTGVMILGTIGLTFTSLYLQWTAVGAYAVDGIQGRYFIPLILPIAMIFMTKEKEVEKKDNLLSFALVQNVLALVAIITTFI